MAQNQMAALRLSAGLDHTQRLRLNVTGRLFQARIWREYAMAWDGKRTTTGVGREWVEKILRLSRAECLRRARVNVYLARRLNRAVKPNTERSDPATS